jgi:hypothetical protein
MTQHPFIFHVQLKITLKASFSLSMKIEERALQISAQPYEVEDLIECHIWELTNEDLDEFISEDNNEDDVAEQTALNLKAPAEITKLRGMLIDEMMAFFFFFFKAISLKFKRKV